MIEALICVHASMDYNDWKCCFAGISECLCLQSTYRLAVDVVLRSVGCSHDPTRGECCKCGVYCCDCALIQPRVCCGAARQTRCIAGPGPQGFMNKPACALYFVSCMPKCGCCVPPRKSPALASIFVANQAMYDSAPALPPSIAAKMTMKLKW